MKLNQVFEACGGRVNGGSEFGWACYGDARYMDFCDSDGNDDVVNCVYSPATQEIFEVQVWVNDDNVVYSWRNPEYKKAYKAEAKERGVDANNAFDNIQYTKVKSEEEILDLAQKMIHGTYVHSKGLIEHEYVASNGMKVMIHTSSDDPYSAWPFPTGDKPTGCCGGGSCGGCGDDESECGGGCNDASGGCDHCDDHEEDCGWDETLGGSDLEDINEQLRLASEELKEASAKVHKYIDDIAQEQTTWDVVLTTKHRLEIKAETMEDAYAKAQAFKEKVKVHDWGTDVFWIDHWISKYKIGERIE
jgi:hypothetical protein